MKNYLAILGLSAILFSCGSTKPKVDDLALSNPIDTALDLTAVVDDKVPVTINPGRFTTETVTYRLPRVVQGTYSISDFGRYIDSFKALDYDGNELPFTKEDTNTWVVSNATKLDKLQYYVNDTFDTESSGGIGGEDPFSPAGTNIEKDNFVLNLHGFIGYFDSLKNSQYTLEVTAPSDFIRTSALQDKGTITSADGKSVTSSYFAPRYFDITDNPMMYGKLDVEEFMVGDIKIVFSMYSPNGVHTAASQKETVYKMMQAQKKYLGDVNTTPFYNTMMQKIATSMNLDDAMSFTIMSENVLDDPYADQYYNVYMKGALIGMCIDILMRKESDGNRSILSLMKELSAKYGKEKPFVDDNIIAEITEMTYPSVGEFLKTHVEGDVPINYDEFFAMAGLVKGETQVETNYIFAGGQNVVFDADQQKGEIFFSPMALKNSFWVSQGIQTGDVIKKVNGTELNLANANQVIGGMFGWTEGQEITMDLERNGEPILIKATLTKATAQGLLLKLYFKALSTRFKITWFKTATFTFFSVISFFNLNLSSSKLNIFCTDSFIALTLIVSLFLLMSSSDL